MKVLIWGAGNNGHIYRKYLQEFTNNDFVGFVDNNSQLKGVISPCQIRDIAYDVLVISNQYKEDRDEIRAQLQEMHVDEDKIVFLAENDKLKKEVFTAINRYDEQNDRRVVWLASFANYVDFTHMPGNVAECGVNLGEFAYYINKYFNSKKFYLFDTFQGFSEKDLKTERQISGDVFTESIYNTKDLFKLTSIDIVKKRMPNLQQCEFHVGYFPDSAEKVDDKFCFVNLDTDLYQPILAGLEFFYPKMVEGGVILVHDFFNTKLPGVGKAIEDYELKQGIRLHKFPIADYLSLAIVK